VIDLRRYTSARLYKTFKGKTWHKCTMYTAFLYPGLCFVVFVSFDMLLWGYVVSASSRPRRDRSSRPRGRR
jgi:hypothetical protein